MHYLSRFKAVLPDEAKAWVGENLLGESQARQICQKYGLDYDASSKNTAQRTMLILAALFMGAALLLFIQHNWDDIPRLIRLLAMLSITVAFNITGMVFIKGDNGLSPRAEALLTSGAIAYGASIMLIAQVYNVGEHYPDGIFYWALGVMAVAVVVTSKSLATLAAVLAFIWLWVENLQAVLSITMYPVLMLALVPVLQQRSSRTLAFMLLAGGISWWYVCIAWLNGGLYSRVYGNEHFLLIISLPVLLYTLLNICGHSGAVKLRAYQGLISRLLPCAAILAYLCGYYFDWFTRDGWYSPYSLYISLILLIVAAIASVRLGHGSYKPVPVTVIAIYTLAVTMPIVYQMNILSADAHQWMRSYMSDLYVFAVSIAFVAYGIESIRSGLHDRYYFRYCAGVSCVILFSLHLYLELFVGSYLVASAMFAGLSAFAYIMSRRWRRSNAVVSE